MSRGALMLQPIDQLSPVKEASRVQTLPTCGQTRPASSAHQEPATLNFELRGFSSSAEEEQRKEPEGALSNSHPPHPLFIPPFPGRDSKGRQTRKGHYTPWDRADQSPQTCFRCKVTEPPPSSGQLKVWHFWKAHK